MSKKETIWGKIRSLLFFFMICQEFVCKLRLPLPYTLSFSLQESLLFYDSGLLGIHYVVRCLLNINKLLKVWGRNSRNIGFCYCHWHCEGWKIPPCRKLEQIARDFRQTKKNSGEIHNNSFKCLMNLMPFSLHSHKQA